MCRTFKLKKACIDCPFKKGNSYLNPESLKMKIDAVTKQDQSFSCLDFLTSLNGGDSYC